MPQIFTFIKLRILPNPSTYNLEQFFVKNVSVQAVEFLFYAFQKISRTFLVLLHVLQALTYILKYIF